MLERMIERRLPELAAVDGAQRRRIYEQARYDTFARNPGRGVQILLTSLVGAISVPALVLLLAPQWSSDALWRRLLLIAFAGLAAPLLNDLLRARALVPAVRAQLAAQRPTPARLPDGRAR